MWHTILLFVSKYCLAAIHIRIQKEYKTMYWAVGYKQGPTEISMTSTLITSYGTSTLSLSDTRHFSPCLPHNRSIWPNIYSLLALYLITNVIVLPPSKFSLIFLSCEYHILFSEATSTNAKLLVRNPQVSVLICHLCLLKKPLYFAVRD